MARCEHRVDAGSSRAGGQDCALPRCASRSSTSQEAGSASLELAVLTPGLLLFIGLLIAVGRVSQASGVIAEAAVDAARVASISRTAAAAQSQAQAAARATLTQQNVTCAGLSVTVDTGGFGAAVGTPATVSARVTCPVPLADLLVPGLPGTRTVTSTSVSPLDTYRERS